MESKDQTADGLRTICSLDLRSAGVTTFDAMGSAVLEPGDIIVGRGTGNWMSDLIAKLDGYWSHSTLYVGDGRIAHAYTAGIATMTLAELEGYYPDGIGVARPNKSRAEKLRAARWAMDKTEPGPGVPRPLYAGKDLGSAFALLYLARRAALERLRAADPEGPHLMAESTGLSESPIERFESTCSGFVYQAYSEGADSPLEIVPAPAIELTDGVLRVADEPGLWRELNEVRPDAGPATFGVTNWDSWAAKVRLLKDALAGCIEAMGNMDEGIALEHGVTPADLWCSPSVEQRWFLTENHQQVALDEAAHCP